ncbi:MAG: hypothetical protein HC803_02825 [Saprospiraceae bacterium]|nr:hypothetical protein [Saprospiraceae bacterium]
MNYQWNFGDVYSGIWDFKPCSRNTPTGVLTTHVFDSSGTFIIELEVSDFKGNSAIETLVIRVIHQNDFTKVARFVFLPITILKVVLKMLKK